MMSWGPARWTPPTSGEKISWVFVMRANLARAHNDVGLVKYVELR